MGQNHKLVCHGPLVWNYIVKAWAQEIIGQPDSASSL